MGDEPMTYAIPVVDLQHPELAAVRAGTEELGAVQVVNHGVPEELSGDLGRRMARLLGWPRAEKAELASPHPYRGWRQWPDDVGRLELERFNVAQFDSVADARAAPGGGGRHGDPAVDRGVRVPVAGRGGGAVRPVRGGLGSRADGIGPGVGSGQGPGGGLPGDLRPPGTDSGLARRSAVRGGTGQELGGPIAGIGGQAAAGDDRKRQYEVN